ncbi:MAG: MarR family winged helix-turn-helix transcriptional regulator [Hyphomicrobiaceae bacterium]
MPVTTSLLQLVHRIDQKGGERFAFRHPDVTLRQMLVLQAIAETPDGSQAALVRRTGIDRSTMAEIVKRLVRRGMISRRRSRTDERAYKVRLTPQGEAILDVAAPYLEQVEADLLAAVPEAAREQFIQALEKIAHSDWETDAASTT